jgi:hypothetical protein
MTCSEAVVGAGAATSTSAAASRNVDVLLIVDSFPLVFVIERLPAQVWLLERKRARHPGAASNIYPSGWVILVRAMMIF